MRGRERGQLSDGQLSEGREELSDGEGEGGS